jgi:outer membrane receptor protein involved in Fe transport
MGFISEAISGIRLNMNVTLNRSSIEMSDTEYESRVDNARDGETIDRYRNMAGQSPYLVNGGIAYTGGENGFFERFEAGLYYNVQGSTLEYVGAADRPDIFVEPFHSLNFNTSVKLGRSKRVSLGLKVENLLNEDVKLVYKSYKAADQYFERRSPGILSTLKISYNFGS